MSDLYIFGVQSASSLPDISSATVVLGSTNTYDGTEKTQTITSVTLGGVTLVNGTDYIVTDNTATNAGSYTLTILGIGNYGGVKQVEWSINKAQGSISVSPSALEIDSGGNTDTAMITVIGDGAVSVSTNANSVATATVSGNIITVTSGSTGNATITVTLAAGVNYTGSSVTISVSVVMAPPDPVLANNTLAQIQAAAQAGTAATLWSVGDRTAEISFQNVTVGSLSFNGLSACAFVLGFDHNSSKEGTGIHFQIGMNTSGTKIAFVDSSFSNYGSGAMFHMNSNGTNSGGWNSSYMRSTICPAFLTALPTAWQNVITTTSKYTDNSGGGSSNYVTQTATSDKIWLLSEYEVFGSQSYAASTESTAQAQYTYYKNGNSKVFYKHNSTSTICIWWLRSPRYDISGGFCYVAGGGYANYDGAYCSFGFAPGFRIA